MRTSHINILIIFFLLLQPLHKLTAQRALNKADNAYNFQNYQEAISLYKSFESSLPETDERGAVLLKIGSCYSKLNNPILAEKYFDMAFVYKVILTDELSLEYINALVETGKYQKAIDFLANYEGVIYFENIIINTCNYALTHPESNDSVHLFSIDNSQWENINGIYFHDNQLVITTPYSLSKKQFTKYYTYSIDTDSTTESGDLNRELSRIKVYTPTINTDNNTIYFSSNISRQNKYSESNRSELKISSGGSNNLGIFEITVNTDGTEKHSQMLPFINFEYNTTHPFFSTETQTLYFSSDIPGGYGGFDLYYTVKNENGWTRPVNLGPEVNTILDEGYPYVFNEILYFASRGHPGYGGLDIYSFDARTNEIKNLDKPFNSSFDDFYSIIINTKEGFLISNRDRNDGRDIIYYYTKNTH